MTALPILVLINLHGARKVPYRFAPDEDYLPVDVLLDKPIKHADLDRLYQVLDLERRTVA